MIAKPYIRFLMGEILKNRNYHYTIECYGDIAVELTRDLSECANHKAGDKYKGVNAFDECKVYIYDMSLHDGHRNLDESCIGFLGWTNWNDGVEKLYDYSINLEKQVKTASKKYERQVEFI